MTFDHGASPSRIAPRQLPGGSTPRADPISELYFAGNASAACRGEDGTRNPAQSCIRDHADVVETSKTQIACRDRNECSGPQLAGSKIRGDRKRNSACWPGDSQAKPHRDLRTTKARGENSPQ